MEWLHDLGLSTRRSLARAAKHTGGVLEHVGTAVDTVAHTADAILPPRLGEVHSEVHAADATDGGERTGVSSSLGCSAVHGHRNVPHWTISRRGTVSAVPTSSLHGSASPRSRRAAEAAGADVVDYEDADECIVDQEDEAAPMSRGLLGLGMHRDAR